MTADDKHHLIWEQRWVGRPSGTHYSAGGASPLLRDNETNRLSTHAVFGNSSESPSDGSTGESAAVRALAVLGAATLAAAATYGAKRLWDAAMSMRKASTVEDVEPPDDVSAAANADDQEALIDEVNALIAETEGQDRRVDTGESVNADLDDEDSDARVRKPRRTPRRR